MAQVVFQEIIYLYIAYLPPDNSICVHKNEIDCIGDLNGRPSSNRDYIISDTDML